MLYAINWTTQLSMLYAVLQTVVKHTKFCEIANKISFNLIWQGIKHKVENEIKELKTVETKKKVIIRR